MKIISKENLEKLQKCEFEILEEFERICKKHNLKYSLTFGTLLGAKRHQGFIPWDDDIDVMMPIDDYLKFEDIVKTELNEKFFFQNKFTDKNYYLYWNKLRMKNTVSVVRGYEQMDLNWGICIDIFPIFKKPANIDEKNKQIKNLKLSIACLESILYKYGKKENAKGKTKMLYQILSILPRKFVNRLSEYFYKKIYKYTGSYDGYIDYSEIFNREILISKEAFDDMESLPFNNKKFNVIKNYEDFLIQLYGDYMKLPPKKDRVAHGDLILNFESDDIYE